MGNHDRFERESIRRDAEGRDWPGEHLDADVALERGSPDALCGELWARRDHPDCVTTGNPLPIQARAVHASKSSSRRAVRELVGLYWESGVSADIPALAWYLLASLVPLALGLTALAAVILGDYAEAQALAGRVFRVLPKDVHDQIVALVLRTKRNSPLLIAGAILGMVWTSSGSVGVIDRCLRRTLSIKAPNPVVGKLRNVGEAFAVALLVVVMVLLATAGTGLVERLHLDPTLTRVS